MLEVLSLTVRFDPRSVELQLGGAAPQAVSLQDRAADRVIDSLYILLDALALPAPPTELRIHTPSPRVEVSTSAGKRELDSAAVARLPDLAVAAPLLVARREAGDADASSVADALVGHAGFWAARYREHDLGWDLGEAAPPLVRAFRDLRPGRAVVVGCGQGHEVRALARLGFEAVGVDFAPEAVERARALTAQERLRATFATADVLTLPAALGAFDYWVEHTCFCAIDPSRRDDYVAAAGRTLSSGGALIGLFYAHTRPSGPPFATSEAELRRRFEPAFIIESLERAPDSIERRRGDELLGRFRRR